MLYVISRGGKVDRLINEWAADHENIEATNIEFMKRFRMGDAWGNGVEVVDRNRYLERNFEEFVLKDEAWDRVAARNY